MGWIVAAVVAVVVLIAVIVSVTRYNKLSLARAVCTEGCRQLTSALRDRRALAPHFRAGVLEASLTTIPPERLDGFDEALAQVNARPLDMDVERTAVLTSEERLAEQIDQLFLCIGNGASPRAQADDDSDFQTVTSLYSQLDALDVSAIASVRYFNLNARRYERLRTSPASVLVRAFFDPIALMRYERTFITGADSDEADALVPHEDDSTPQGEN